MNFNREYELELWLSKWFNLVETCYEKLNSEMKTMYVQQKELDAHLSRVYVDKLTKFFQQFLKINDIYSLEAPESLSDTKKHFVLT